jgi:uncharacterized membrane protein YgcG
MNKVNCLEDARRWFLENHTGTLRCTNDEGEYRDCTCFPEAESFYTTETECSDDSDDISTGLAVGLGAAELISESVGGDSTPDPAPDTSSSFESGGGDFGGGGAGRDF